jgi:hypothetical protein
MGDGIALPLPAAAPTAAPPAAAAPAPGPGIPLGDAALDQVPDRLQLLDRPVVLTGTVIAASEGAVRVRTQAGELVLRLAAPVSLPEDQPVTIQIEPGHPPTQARAFVPQPLLPQALPDPRSGMRGEPAVTTTLGNLARAALTAPPETLPAPLANQVVVAQVLPSALPRPGAMPAGRAGPLADAPAPGAAAPGTAAAGPLSPGPLPPGGAASPAGPRATPAPPSAAASTAPAAVPTGATPTGATSAGAPSASPPQAAAPAPPSPAVALPLAGGSLVVRLLPPAAAAAPGPGAAAEPGTIPLSGPGPGSEAEPAGPVLAGTVVGTTANGRPVVATPGGLLALALRQPLTPGTLLRLELLPDPAQQILNRTLSAVASAAAGAPGPFPTLQDLFSVLTANNGALAQALAATVLPRPNQRLGAAMAFFLGAARAGDARGWLGAEVTKALEDAGRADLPEQLEKEFEATAREARSTPPGEWSPYTMPMLDRDTIKPVWLFVRAPQPDPDEQNDGHPKGGGGRRFLVEVNLSRLGALQLDGLVRPHRFDLILRSAKALPDDLCRNLISVFTDCLGATGFTGQLSFQYGTKGWVRPPPARPAPTRSRGIVA